MLDRDIKRDTPLLLVLQGIPASGKSTFAKQWVEDDFETRVIVNRDSIRRMLGPYWIPSREHLVSYIEMDAVEAAIENGYDVCIDATNLNPKTIKKWESVAEWFETYIEFKEFKISLEEAIERDKNREFPVGENVITNFYNKYYGSRKS